MELDHVGLVVSDLDRSLAWWEGAVGAESPGAAGIELVEAAAAAAGPFALPNDSVGGMHVCLRVCDIGRAHVRLLANDVVPSTPPRELVPGVFSLYFRDPDGIQFQFIEAGEGIALHHFAYNVSDLDATLSWYSATFGLSPTFRSSSVGSHISELLGTVGAAYDVALLPVGDALLELMEWHDGTPPAARPGHGSPGAWHVALSVSDLQDVPAGGSCYDPDGFLVQVAQL
jgi:catechol 2,3-dioxygenase-like lactoylglutathione lyase family enzyme